MVHRHWQVEPTATVLEIKALFHKSCEFTWIPLWFNDVKPNISFSLASLENCVSTDPKWYPARQSLRLDPSMSAFFLYLLFLHHHSRIAECALIVCRRCSAESKCLRDEEVLQTLPVGTTASFYFSDLGPQLTWGTVSPRRCNTPLISPSIFSSCCCILLLLLLLLAHRQSSNADVTILISPLVGIRYVFYTILSTMRKLF